MFEFTTPKKAVSTAFYKLPVLQQDIEWLSKNLDMYIKSGKPSESEEYHKGLIKDFLLNTWYASDYSINTNGREDLGSVQKARRSALTVRHNTWSSPLPAILICCSSGRKKDGSACTTSSI